ncbi:MAG: hypothetical protein ABR573_06890 [Candidatus Dormibacteria bacterium]
MNRRINARTAVLPALLGLAFGLVATTAPALAGTIQYHVAITKSHAGNFTVGQDGVFKISLSNSGPTPTYNDTFTVIDTLPSGLTYKADTGSGAGLPCNRSGQTVTCSGAPNLASGQTVSFAITVTPSTAGTLTNQVSFSVSPNNDTSSANHSATDSVVVAAASSPSPSPSVSPSASASPTAAVAPVKLPRSGLPARQEGPAWLVGLLAVTIVTGAAVALRRAAGR